MLVSHRLRVSTLFTLALLAWQVPAHATGDTFYSGSAIGVQGTVKLGDLAVKIALAENYMSCTGAPKTETVATLTHPLPIGIQSKTVTTFTQGRDGTATADTKIQDLKLTLPGLNVAASAVASHAEARCDASHQITTVGGSILANLKINGQSVVITGKPNQTVTIPNVGTVTINQQIKRLEGEFTSFRAVALRVKLLQSTTVASADLAIASSKANVFCD